MLRIQFSKLIPMTLAAIAMLLVSPSLIAEELAIWTDVSEESIPSPGERLIVPDHYRLVALDPEALEAVLRITPLEGSNNASVETITLALPLP
ncbi:MAG: hypothetical protein GY906_29860, partial [bacterium]|nr:hypothetical protein [bacterium]